MCYKNVASQSVYTPANTSTSNQRWNKVENESWADVPLSTLFQGWENNVETTLTELRRFSADEPMLFQR